MRLKLIFGKFIRFFLISLVLLQLNCKHLNALEMTKINDENVIEELRLNVPSKYKDVWLMVEKDVWEPWLSSQDGFLERQLFWDKEKEEALILITWKNKKLWKSIPSSEVNLVQEKFEDNVKTTLIVEENPFVLIYEGELDKQG